MMAAPVFLPCGEYTVMVGRETCSMASHGLPATSDPVPVLSTISGPSVGRGSGAAPGHIGTCACPGDGCQTVCACRTLTAKKTQKANSVFIITDGEIAGGADIAVYVCVPNQGAHTLGSDVSATCAVCHLRPFGPLNSMKVMPLSTLRHPRASYNLQASGVE